MTAPGLILSTDFYAGIAPEATSKLREQAALIREKITKTTADIIDIGRDLSAAKKYLKHGQFLIWVEAEIGIATRTAQAYMGAFKLAKKCATVAYLPPAAVYRLAARSTPPVVVEKVIAKTVAGQAVTEKMVADMIATIKERRTEDRRLSPRLNPIARAWIQAKEAQRREFAIDYQADIIRAQQQHELSAEQSRIKAIADRAEAASDRKRDAGTTSAVDPLSTSDMPDIPEFLRRSAP